MSVGGTTYPVNTAAATSDEYVRDVIRIAAYDQYDTTIRDQTYTYEGGDGSDVEVLIQYFYYSDGRKSSFTNNTVSFLPTGGRDYFENTVYFQAGKSGSSEYAGNNVSFGLGDKGGNIKYTAISILEPGTFNSGKSSYVANNINMIGSFTRDNILLQIGATSEISGNSIFLDAGGGNDIINTAFGLGGASQVTSNAVTVSGGDGNDIIYSQIAIPQVGSPNIFESNDFEIVGGSGDDEIYFNINTDYLINGGADEDSQNSFLVDGGSGDDVLRLGLRTDSGFSYFLDFSQDYNASAPGVTFRGFERASINVGNSADTIIGGDGSDTINGAGGADSMAGGLGDDVYYVDNAMDIVDELTGQGTDTIFTSVSMALSDDQSIEILAAYGPRINYRLEGNSIANTIIGGDRDDILIGGEGSDRLTGGAGRDTFLYRTISEAGLGVNRDVIQDFVRGQDVVDLSAIQAVAGASTDQAFSFLGTGAYTGQAGQLRATQNGSVAVVQGDVNGDMRSDFQIYLANITASTLQAGDFSL